MNGQLIQSHLTRHDGSAQPALRLPRARTRTLAVEQANAADRTIVVFGALPIRCAEADCPASNIEATGTPYALRAIIEEVRAGAGAVDAFATGAGVATEAAVAGIGRQIDALALAARLLTAAATALLLADALLAALPLVALALLGLNAREDASAKEGREQTSGCQAHAPPGPRIKSRSIHRMSPLIAMSRRHLPLTTGPTLGSGC
jgi:hypothetical protein